MTRPGLELSRLRESFAPEVFERGERCRQSGDVLNLLLRGNTVSASVRGSEARPYRVTLTLAEGNLESADCTCPYAESFGEPCKHIAAAALEYLYRPETIISEASVGDLLEPLSTNDLHGALTHLLRLHPELVNELELHLQKLRLHRQPEPSPKPDDPPAAATLEATLDTRLFEKMMRSAVRGAGRDYHEFPEYDEVYGVIAELKPFLERAAYRDALALGEALVKTFIDEVNADESSYDNIGFSDEGVFAELDAALAEAVLGTVLGDGERKRLLYEVLAWNDQIGNEWTSPDFNLTAHALAEGFQDRTQNRGDEVDELLAEVARLELSGPYQEIRLRALRATGRSDEALAFAKTTGEGAGYLELLLEGDRLGQVMDEYREHLENEQEALLVAQRLAPDYPREALELAQHALTRGLTRQGSAQNNSARWPEFLMSNDYANDATKDRLALASFTKDLASRLGEYEATLSSSLTEFELSASLPRYEALQTLVGDDWSRVRRELLEGLRRADYAKRHAAADIFLKENLPDDAVGVASRFSGDDALLRRVMDAVMGTRAPWIIEAACKEAEPVMDGARSNHYGEAAAWLGYVKRAYHALEQGAAWDAYIAAVRGKHKRKYRLMAELEGL